MIPITTPRPSRSLRNRRSLVSDWCKGLIKFIQRSNGVMGGGVEEVPGALCDWSMVLVTILFAR